MANLDALQGIPPPESNAWWPRLRDIFNTKLTDRLVEVRGEATGIDMDPLQNHGYAYAEQRGAISADKWQQGSRGHQSRIPTPQELIRQVTGVGDPIRGR